MTTFDHYAAVRELVTLLDDAKLTAEAAALRSAMADGATGTEILMALRSRVSNIVDQAVLGGKSETLALTLLSELSRSLGED